jgi:hypothetical protein
MKSLFKNEYSGLLAIAGTALQLWAICLLPGSWAWEVPNSFVGRFAVVIAASALAIGLVILVIDAIMGIKNSIQFGGRQFAGTILSSDKRLLSFFFLESIALILLVAVAAIIYLLVRVIDSIAGAFVQSVGKFLGVPDSR